jgi:S-layer protein
MTDAAVVTVSDTATTDTLTTVSIDGNSGGAATVTSDALTSLSLANTTQAATVTAAAGTRTLDLNVDNVTVIAAITDNTATTVAINATGAASSIGLTAAAAKALNLAGDKELTLAAAPATVTAITSTNTAGVTITGALGNTQVFTGGDGADKLEVGATTKTIDMGAGDDRVLITTGNNKLGAGGSLAGGDGTDTLAMDADDAAAASLGTAFEGSFAGFEVFELSGAAAAAGAIDLANLDDIATVKVSADIGFAATLNNLASGGTVNYTTAQTANAIVTVTNAAAGTDDVLNVGIENVAGINVQTITAANVETVNIATDDTAATPTGIAHTATLTAANAKALTVSGDAGITLTLTGSTALATIDTSSVTKGAVSVTTVGTGSVTMTGGDTDTTFNASSATKAATITTGAGDDTTIGGAGDDIINAGNGINNILGGGGKDTLSGGTGVDTYFYTAVTDSQGTKVDVISNLEVGTGGDVIDMSAVTAGTGAYLGEANGYGAVLTSMTGTVGDTVLDSSTSTLYIDVDGDAALNSNDMAIQLTGVTSGLVAANFVF